MKKYTYYTANQIKPDGWLKRQLEIQANGLNGNLHKVWRDIRDSKYIGGDADDWERVPYWLDGFIPLAYLLDDSDLIATAKKYVDAVLSFQKPSGWMCPCSEDEVSTYDTWAVLLLSKVLTVYYDCSKDERIPDRLYRMMKNYFDLLKEGQIKLFDWAKHRWFEGFFAIELLKEKYTDSWITELAEILKSQGKNYAEDTERWKKPLFKWTLDTHIVNLTMMLKSEAVCCAVLGSEYTDMAEELYQALYRYNGTPVEIFTGDECLSGLSPIRGTELCSVVELMFSYETIYAVTGDEKWLERLETVAFNALPATLSDDMWTHQYDQMSNQISCMKFPGKPIFGTNNGESHLFGLEPNFGCCTANFGQGFPKLALSAFVHGGDVIKNVLLLPSVLDCNEAIIRLETNYPFENRAVFTVEGREDFKFSVRIPSFAQNIRINGTEGQPAEFDIKKGDKCRFELTFDTSAQVVARPHDLFCVKKGSLVFSLPIEYEKIMHEYEKNGVERKFPYCDYELEGRSKWNYALASDLFEEQFIGVSDTPFSSERPPVVLKAKMKEIVWDTEEGYEQVCATSPGKAVPLGEAEQKVLCPYGCAKLRMTEVPFIKK